MSDFESLFSDDAFRKIAASPLSLQTHLNESFTNTTDERSRSNSSPRVLGFGRSSPKPLERSLDFSSTMTSGHRPTPQRQLRAMAVGDTLASRLRRTVSSASPCSNPTAVSVCRHARDPRDPRRIEILAEPKRSFSEGGSVPVMKPLVCSTPPMDGIYATQCETGSRYVQVPRSADKLRLVLRFDVPLEPRKRLRRARRAVYPVRLAQSDDAVVYLDRPIAREARNSLISLRETTGVIFLCFVLSLQMEIIAVLDLTHSGGTCFPGVELSPAFIEQRRKAMASDDYRANALEISLDNLPQSVFALVPVVVFPRGLSLGDADGGFICELFARKAEDAEAYPYRGWGRRECDGLPVNRQPGRPPTRRERVASFDEAALFATPRSAEALGGEDRPTIMEWSRIAQTVLSLKYDDESYPNYRAFVPMVLFRHSGGSFGLQLVSRTLDNAASSRDLPGAIVALLTDACLLPFCSVHVEHCANCHEHATTSQHVPGSYEKRATELRQFVKNAMPPLFFYCNSSSVLNGPPRRGSFEISILPYCAREPQLLYSKLSNHEFPLQRRIVRALASVLLPESTKFKYPKVVKLCVLESCSRRPIAGVSVEIVKLTVTAIASRDFGDETLPTVPDADSEAHTSPEVVVHDAEATTLLAAGESPGDLVVPVPKASKTRRRSLASGDVLRNPSPESTVLRHSQAYFLLRAWGKRECVQWFRSCGFSEDIISNMLAAGVCNGEQLLKQVNERSLRRWGVRYKKGLDAAISSLSALMNTPGDILYSQTFVDANVAAVSKSVPQHKGVSGQELISYSVAASSTTDNNGLAILTVSEVGSYVIRAHAHDATGSVLLAYQSPMMRFDLNSLHSQNLVADASFHTGSVRVTVACNKNTVKLFLGRTGILVGFRRLRDGHRFSLFLPFKSAFFDDGQRLKLRAAKTLPVGSYVSEVDGAVLSISDESELQPVELLYGNTRQLSRRHRKLVARALSRFQLKIRWRRRRVLSDMETRALSCVRRLMTRSSYLDDLRERVQTHQALRWKAAGKLLLFQALLRGHLARKNASQLIGDAGSVLEFARSSYRHKSQSALGLQRVVRGWLCRTNVVKRRREEMYGAKLVRFCRMRVPSRVQRVLERVRRGEETYLMRREESLTLGILREENEQALKVKQQERAKVDRMLQKMRLIQEEAIRRAVADQMRNLLLQTKCATKIQCTYRAWARRVDYTLLRESVIIAQRAVRELLVHKRKVREARESLATIMRIGSSTSTGSRAAVRGGKRFSAVKRSSAASISPLKSRSNVGDSVDSITEDGSVPRWKHLAAVQGHALVDLNAGSSSSLRKRNGSNKISGAAMPIELAPETSPTLSRKTGSQKASLQAVTIALSGSAKSQVSTRDIAGPSIDDDASAVVTEPLVPLVSNKSVENTSDKGSFWSGISNLAKHYPLFSVADERVEISGASSYKPTKSTKVADEATKVIAATVVQTAYRSYRLRRAVVSPVEPVVEAPAKAASTGIELSAAPHESRPLVQCLVDLSRSSLKAGRITLNRAYRKIANSSLVRELKEIKDSRLSEVWGGRVSAEDFADTKARETRRKGIKIAGTDALLLVSGFSYVLSREVALQWYLSVDSAVAGNSAEPSTRSANQGVLTSQSVEGIELFVHMLDLDRYSLVSVCLHASVLRSDRPGDSKKEMFVVAYRGICKINGGRAFGPQGGTACVALARCDGDLARYPHTRELLEPKWAKMRVTLIPVAGPSSAMLARFKAADRLPLPCELVDAALLEHSPMKWNTYGTQPICMGFYSDRVLVSCSRTRELLQYDCKGWYDGKMDLGSAVSGNIVVMVTGLNHIVFGMSTGALATLAKQDGGPVQEGPLNWCKISPVALNSHAAAVRLGCATVLGGADVFILVDADNCVSLQIFEQGRCLKRRTFPVQATGVITAIAAYHNRLYVCNSTGELLAFDLRLLVTHLATPSASMDSFARISTRVGEDGIASMAVIASAGFLGLTSDDSSYSSGGLQLASLLKDDHSLHEANEETCMEGHVILTGGSENPIIRILRVYEGQLREVGGLQGHSSSVTSLLGDAAGRYIISASTKEILVWDAITFVCERKFQGLNISSLTLGADAIFGISPSFPFIQCWRVPDEARAPHVAVIRSPDWCFKALARGHMQPESQVKSILDETSLDYAHVVARWESCPGIRSGARELAELAAQNNRPDELSHSNEVLADVDAFLDEHTKFIAEREGDDLLESAAPVAPATSQIDSDSDDDESDSQLPRAVVSEGRVLVRRLIDESSDSSDSD